MNPELISLIASFTIKLINEFQSRNDAPTEAEIMARFEQHYNDAITKNQQISDETK